MMKVMWIARLIFVLALTCAAAWGQSIPASRAARNVAIITIKGEIDAKGVMAQSVRRRIDAAARDGADAIVFEIDTPGGAVPTVLKICEAIRASPVRNTTAWVNPEAFSGGAVIALACGQILVSDKASFGDAMPIMISPTDMLLGGATAPSSPELLKKILPPLLSEVTQSARAYNTANGAYLRDEYLVQSIVANDVELWYVRNTTTGVRMCVDRDEFRMLFPDAALGGATRLPSSPSTGKLELPAAEAGKSDIGVPAGSRKIALAAPETTAIAPSLRPRITAADAGAWELIDKVKDDSLPAVFKAADMQHYGLSDNVATTVDGRATFTPINTDEDLKAHFGAAAVQRYESNWSESLVDLLTSTIVQGVLVVIFLVAIFVEMTHPGALVPGLVSAAALVLLVAPGLLIGMASWWEVAAILLGILLIGLEILVIPGFGVAGVLGLALLFIGLIGLFVPAGTGPFPDTPEARRDVLRGGATLLLSFGTAGVLMYLVARNFGSLPLLHRLVLQAPLADDASGSVMEEEFETGVRAGDIGLSITPMRPAGRVQVGERIIDAVAEMGFIEAGCDVRVVKVDGMRVSVEATRPVA
jgi:hypothetical protein